MVKKVVEFVLVDRRIIEAIDHKCELSRVLTKRIFVIGLLFAVGVYSPKEDEP